MPLVSAIITTRNRGQLLPRAVDSVLGQSFKDFELIVVDDASSDGTPEVIAGYGNVCRGLRVEESRGANHARNRGLALARGELVAYLDDDDCWLPRKLERQTSTFREVPDAALVGCRFRVDGKVRKIPPEVGYGALLNENLLGGFSMCMFPRTLAEELGGMDETLSNSQDWDLWLKLSRRGRTLCIPECLVEYSTSQPHRISAKKDLQRHYDNYLRVAYRHREDMSALISWKHRLTAKYNTTVNSRLLPKVGLGILYFAIRSAARVQERLSFPRPRSLTAAEGSAVSGNRSEPLDQRPPGHRHLKN